MENSRPFFNYEFIITQIKVSDMLPSTNMIFLFIDFYV